MKSTREKILLTLLKKPQSTISDLAESVDINTISVRHHLSSLQVDNLIVAEEVRHGVGRPRLVYSLTEEGLEKFPTRYFRLTNRILKRVRKSVSDEQVGELFIEIAKDIASDHQKHLKLLSIEEKLTYIQNLLDEEGFYVDWEKQENQYVINEVSCPYYQVVLNNPEVCNLDQTLISEMLSIPAKKIECILTGGKHCSYVITFESTEKL
ncbi:MAG: helix-turn-helix transcriptional regulator [Anaerolineaceae bacterium]